LPSSKDPAICDRRLYAARRSIKILPGVRFNFGKRGVSTSVGVRGAHVTFGKAGTRTTVGLPGSGLSYTHLEKPHQSEGGESPGIKRAYHESGSFMAEMPLRAVIRHR
jgi:hypothetical protein